MAVFVWVFFFGALISQYIAWVKTTGWVWQDVYGLILLLGLCGGPAIILSDRNQRLPAAGRFGLSIRRLPKTLAISLLHFGVATGLTMLTLMATMQICKWFGHDAIPVHETLTNLRTSPTFRSTLMLAIPAVLLAPIMEELFFRGMVQCFFIWMGGFLLMRRQGGPKKEPQGGFPSLSVSPLSRWAGIVITAALFALYHQNWQHMPALFILAMGMGYAYERYGNLLIPILIHSFFNLLQVAATLLNRLPD